MPMLVCNGFTSTPVSEATYSREAYPLHTPTSLLGRLEVRAEQDPCNFNPNYIIAAKTDEA